MNLKFLIGTLNTNFSFSIVDYHRAVLYSTKVLRKIYKLALIGDTA